jgi:hypothetical protein
MIFKSVFQPIKNNIAVLKKFLIILTLLFSFYAFGYSQSDLKLWYNKPAEQWTEALPLGNGRLGAMVFGKVNEVEKFECKRYFQCSY